MNVVIEPRKLTGFLNVISSKSLSHRYVIAAGLALGKSTIHNVLDSDDLKATKDALFHFGVRFEHDDIYGHSLVYDGTNIQANESGSTLRFLIPIAMMQDQEVLFLGRGKLPERPLNVYKDLFSHRHMFESIGDKELPLKVKGPLLGGNYELRGDVSSQFISGLLFALPLAHKDSYITYQTPLLSKDYVGLTCDVIKEFGIIVKEESNGYYIPGNQKYHPIQTSVEGDFSQAAFFMVAGIIGESIKMASLNPHSKQGDQKICDIIKQMGGNLSYNENEQCYIAYPSVTKATTIDLTHIPDLGPILMVLASLSLGKTRFLGVKRLKIKESDRLIAMYDALTKLGIHMEIQEDEAWIEGSTHFKGHVTLDGCQDHRIVMALTIASIRANGPITITDKEAISKSFPTFFEVFQSLGGKIL